MLKRLAAQRMHFYHLQFAGAASVASSAKCVNCVYFAIPCIHVCMQCEHFARSFSLFDSGIFIDFSSTCWERYTLIKPANRTTKPNKWMKNSHQRYRPHCHVHPVAIPLPSTGNSIAITDRLLCNISIDQWIEYVQRLDNHCKSTLQRSTHIPLNWLDACLLSIN